MRRSGRVVTEFEVPLAIVAHQCSAADVESRETRNKATCGTSECKSNALLLGNWYSRCEGMPNSRSRPNFKE